MAFAVLYGFFCGCFISLTPAVCAQLYGAGRLAGLSGLTSLFNLPGMNSLSRASIGATLDAEHRKRRRGAVGERNPEQERE